MSRQVKAPLLLLVAALICTACAIRQPAGTPAPSMGPADESARLMTVMTYNIKHGQGNAPCSPPIPGTATPRSDCNLDLEGSIAVINDQAPDILALQEVDRFWARSAGVDQPRVLASATGLTYHCFGANLDHAADAHASTPHQYGTAILSKLPIIECRNTPLPTLESWEQRGILAARIQGPHGPLQVYSTHLQASRAIDGKSVSGAAQRVQQVRAILTSVTHETAPIVLMGDFNANPWSAEMAPLFAALTDAWAARGTGTGHTSPADPVRSAASRIDYVFVSRDVEVRSVSVPVDARTRHASDHYPVVARVAIPDRLKASVN